MKPAFAALCLAAACAPMEHRFVKIDRDFAANSRPEPPKVYVDETEMLKQRAPPYRFVGVVEVKGKETEMLKTFYERVAQAGSDSGCDAMLQRDAYFGVLVDQHSMGRNLRRNDMAIWQFLCGVGGATEAEAAATLKQAVAMAVRMRFDEMGSKEMCAAYTPLGSHVHKDRVCADDPKGRTRPDGSNTNR